MAKDELSAPSLPWRGASRLTITFVGAVSKCFLNLACSTKVHGLDNFTKLLDERRDISKRERGLLTGMELDSKISAI
jgi:monolysocardiolipin acyltransferase